MGKWKQNLQQHQATTESFYTFTMIRHEDPTFPLQLTKWAIALSGSSMWKWIAQLWLGTPIGNFEPQDDPLVPTGMVH